MIMTPSKTGLQQEGWKTSAATEWTAALGKSGAGASDARTVSGKSEAWWDRVANIIAGRR